MSDAQYDLRNLCLYIWLPALWAKPTVKKPSTTLAVIDIALDYQLSVLYGTFLHQGNIGKVLVAFLWLIYKPRWFATMYCMWNKSAQKQFSYESYYQSAHHIMAKPKLWMHRLLQLPKGIKDSAISQGNRSHLYMFSLGPAPRPGRVMVLMCVSVCLPVCLLVCLSPPEVWTFRYLLDTLDL